MPKKGVLPTAVRPVLAMDDNALLKALFPRAVPDLKNLLVILVPSHSGIKCLEEIIHRRIPDIIGSLLEPGPFERLYRLSVDCPGSQRLLRSRDSLILYGAQTFVVCPPRCPHPVEQNLFLLRRGVQSYFSRLLRSRLFQLLPFGRPFLTSVVIHQPFEVVADLSARRPPKASAPTTRNCLLAPVFGLTPRRRRRRRRRQPHLLAYSSRNTVPERYRETLLLLFCLLQIHG
ncbi:hypothetical protein V1517DRAFT_106758 [Lipomyces orientalis]|uniref:Uncharacterized protein n=1 Tax=Lipomyces orientalis TaxID=1233043 RepID=A0ACC3TSR3_9ASCO